MKVENYLILKIRIGEHVKHTGVTVRQTIASKGRKNAI
jgi:hypothetical protein